MSKELTKEECLDIIDFLDFFYGDNLIATAKLREEKSKEMQEKDLRSFKSKLDKLKQLINEHFDNPPLKFEELEKGMWVWDNRRNCFLKITRVEVDQWNRHFLHHYYDINMNGTTCTLFGENRFYRKEVKHD